MIKGSVKKSNNRYIFVKSAIVKRPHWSAKQKKQFLHGNTFLKASLTELRTREIAPHPRSADVTDCGRSIPSLISGQTFFPIIFLLKTHIIHSKFKIERQLNIHKARVKTGTGWGWEASVNH